MAVYRVAAGTQVNANGVVYGPGETFEADEAEVASALRASWVAPVEADRPAKRAPKRS